MDKALEMGKTSATGSFQLFMGQVSSTIIMAVGTIILARLMLPEEYGVYAVALIPSQMINLFHDWGIGPAMTKYIAQYRAANTEEDIHDIIVAGLIFKTATGLALTLLSLTIASFIATTIFNRPETTSLIAIASIVIFSESLLTAARYGFTGFERMELNSLTMISYSTIKTVASPLLVLLGYGALGAVLGYTLSFLVAGIIGLITLYFFLFRGLKRNKAHRLEVSKTIRKMLNYGVPLSISSILVGFMAQFYGFMMVSFCSDVMIGNFRIATNFAVILTFFSAPISTVLFPAFAKLDSEDGGAPHTLRTIFASSVKYTSVLLVPVTLAVMVLSKPMINILFGEKWAYAPLFLTLHATSYLLLGLGDLSMWSLLAGLGETKMKMKLSVLTLSFGLPLAFLLVPNLGITGVILGNLVAGLPSLFLGLHWIWKRYGTIIEWKSSAKIFAASAMAAIVTYLSLTFINTTEWLRLLSGGTIFLAVYITAAPLIGAINQKDINNLRIIFSDLGFVSKLVNLPLAVAEEVARFNPIKKSGH